MQFYRSLTYCVLLACFIVQSVHGQTTSDPTLPETVLARYRKILLDRPAPDAETVREYVENLSADGTWPDIDYADFHPSSWSPREHLRRIRAMAHALTGEHHAPHNDEKLSHALDRALDHWLAKRYRCPNWWHNEIGTPRLMRDTVVLLGARLKGKRRQAALRVIKQHRVRGTAANLLWGAELALHDACLVGAEDRIAQAAHRIWDEIQVGAGEGVQTDWSFFQHGKRLHTFSYGRAYFEIAADLAWQLRGTPLAIPPDKRAILSNYLLEGMQWMTRGTFAPPATIDRAFSRKHGRLGSDLRTVLRRWREVDLERRQEIDRFLAHQQGASDRPFGYRHFPVSDFTTYHRPSGSIFLKTISTRTKSTESVNGENLKGVPYLHCGDHYVVRDGEEYSGLPPVLKWSRLPGLTVPKQRSQRQRRSKQQRTDFVGGVGDGASGLTAMDYVRAAENRDSVSVRKAWFFHGDLMICLLGGWQADPADASLVTSIEQCRLRTEVQTGGTQTETRTLAVGDYLLKRMSWILHHGVGYLPLGQAPLQVHLGPARGSWSSINSRYHDKPGSVADSVFRVEIPHTAEDNLQGYAVLLGANREKLVTICQNPSWTILRNDRRCQSVRFDDGLTMATFYRPGTVGEKPENFGPGEVNRTEGAKLNVDQPCLAMWNGDHLWLSDPTHEAHTLTIHWNGAEKRVTLPPVGEVKMLTMAD